MSNIKLYQGDCSFFIKSFNDNSIDLIITDPPYGVNFKNNFYDDSFDNIISNMPNWYSQWYRILKENSYLYLFVGVKTIHYWIMEGIKEGFNYKNILATRSFNNGSITPKNSFGFQFQPILVFSKGAGKKYNEIDFFKTSELWLKDKRNKNPKPYTYQYPNFISSNVCFSTEKRSVKNLHPNEKNIKLLKFLIEISTQSCDIVLDPFMGSGTTGVACKNSNRNFIGIELDENYFNIAKERIEKS